MAHLQATKPPRPTGMMGASLPPAIMTSASPLRMWLAAAQMPGEVWSWKISQCVRGLHALSQGGQEPACGATARPWAAADARPLPCPAAHPTRRRSWRWRRRWRWSSWGP